MKLYIRKTDLNAYILLKETKEYNYPTYVTLKTLCAICDLSGPKIITKAKMHHGKISEFGITSDNGMPLNIFEFPNKKDAEQFLAWVNVCLLANILRGSR